MSGRMVFWVLGSLFPPLGFLNIVAKFSAQAGDMYQGRLETEDLVPNILWATFSSLSLGALMALTLHLCGSWQLEHWQIWLGSGIYVVMCLLVSLLDN